MKGTASGEGGMPWLILPDAEPADHFSRSTFPKLYKYTSGHE
jgi:hypothetical protein